MHDESGFTLIEVLIAITITGIILTAVIMFLQQGLSIWETTGTTGRWEQHHRVLESKIKSDLGKIYISPLLEKSMFKGDYQGLEWLIIEDSKLKKVKYTVDYYNQQIVRTVQSDIGDIRSESDISENIKSPAELRFFSKLDLHQVNFSFFDPKNNYWENNWSYKDKEYLPAVVKVSISTREFKLPEITADIWVGKIY